MKTITKLLISTVIALSAITATANDSRNVKEYNLEQGVALKGYDPVAYFPEGGGIAQPGRENYSLDYMGAIYYFATEKNLQLFMKDPDKYEPTYGGYCAWAMASGRKVDIDPTLFVIHGRRLHLFISEATKSKFLADVQNTENRADSFWKQISGENPRK